jgi:hypothetical protein
MKIPALKNIAASEVMSDYEHDNASKSDATAEYNSLSLSTDSEENVDLHKFINNSMEENNLSQSNGILLSLSETNNSIKNDCDANPSYITLKQHS